MFYNSIWTGFSTVDFKLSVVCTVESGQTSPGRIDYLKCVARKEDSGNDPADKTYKEFFPWNNTFDALGLGPSPLNAPC